MGAASSESLIADYLAELRRAARDLPRRRRRELIAEIEEHIRDAVGSGASELEIREALDRLGDPEQIVGEELDRLRPQRARGGALEWVAVVLLLVGGFLFVVGWVVGLVMLWCLRVWTLRDKLIGTLVVPGGLFGALVFSSTAVSGSQVCSGPLARAGRRTETICTPGHSVFVSVLYVALLVFLLIGPVVTAIYLGRRIRRPVAV